MAQRHMTGSPSSPDWTSTERKERTNQSHIQRTETGLHTV